MPIPIWIVAGGAVAIGLAVRKGVRARRATRSQLKPIVDVGEGELVQIAGVARPAPASAREPLRGMACAKWTIAIERKHGEGRRTKWRPMVRDDSREDFIVEDATGRALVVGAQVLLPNAAQWRLDARRSVQEFLESHGHTPTEQIRWRETHVLFGQSIRIKGIARRVSDGPGTPARIEVHAPPAGRITVELS